MDVAGWLRNLGLERYKAAFRENDVSAEVLRHLTSEDLKELGVAGVGHRRRLLVAIAKLQPKDTPDDDPVRLAGSFRNAAMAAFVLVGLTACKVSFTKVVTGDPYGQAQARGAQQIAAYNQAQ